MKPHIGEMISVCLLTYNHVNLIESTLQSILHQTLSGYEIIVSDDCSTDGTWELIKQMAAKDSRIRPLQTPYNMGMAGNSNFAVFNSTRPYIALLHHDDLYRQDLLEKWANVFERHSDVSFVFNSYGVYQSDFIYDHPFKREKLDGCWFLERQLFPNWGCPVRGTAMIRRSYWDEVGGMRIQFGLLSDVDLWMRLARIGAVGYVREPIITLRQERPDYYPDIYKYDVHLWSWQRRWFLYEIHGTNRLEYFGMRGIAARYQAWKYWVRVSVATSKMLVYAIVKRRTNILDTCMQGASQYDLWLLHIFRRVVLLFVGKAK